MDRKRQKSKHMIELEHARRPIPEGPERFRVRCIDGRYANLSSTENIPLGATPGADPGRLAATIATLDRLGLEYDPEELFRAYAELVGGEQNLTYHDLETRGCGHMKNLADNPTAFGLKPEEVGFVIDKFINSSAQKYELQGEHTEPEAVVTVGGGIVPINKFTFTEDLVREGKQKLARILVDREYVRLADSMRVEDLAEGLFKTLEEHFYLISRMLASGKELYHADLRLPRVNAILLGVI